MKKSFLLPVAIVIAVTAISSCKNSTSPKNNNSLFPTVMTANVNGRAWSGEIPITGTRNGYFDFSAGDSTSTIALYYTQTDTGTFPVNGNTGDDMFATYDTGSGANDKTYISYANSGSVHFTTNTTSKAIGTFNFKAINMNSPFDTVVITNGTFNIDR